MTPALADFLLSQVPGGTRDDGDDNAESWVEWQVGAYSVACTGVTILLHRNHGSRVIDSGTAGAIFGVVAKIEAALRAAKAV